jgi:hypothetical protein
MKNTMTNMMTILLITATIVSCKKEDAVIDKTNNGTFKVYSEGNVTTVQNLMADTILGISPTTFQPYGSGKFTFFNLATGQIVANSDSASNKWDIAFRGTTILTNNGTSGPGLGGAYVQVGVFADVTKVSSDSTIKIDNAPSYAITTGSNKGWYVYDGLNNLINPIPGRVLIIRTATGKYAKVEILNYYKGGVTPAASASDAVKTSEQRYYTFRYTYQASGSTTF